MYALLTRAPLVSVPKDLLPFDLHVLSLPLAFILSQDQTLHNEAYNPDQRFDLVSFNLYSLSSYLFAILLLLLQFQITFSL